MENENLIVEEQKNNESVPHTNQEEFYAKVGNKIFKTKEEYTKHYQKSIKNIKKNDDDKDEIIKDLTNKIKKLSLTELNDFTEEYQEFILSKLDLDLDENELKENLKLLKKEYPKFLKQIKGNFSNEELKNKEQQKEDGVKFGKGILHL